MRVSHRLGPIFVTLADDRAIAQCAAIVEHPFTLKGTEVTMSSHVRLLLRAERRAAVWRLSGFNSVHLRDAIAAAIPGQIVTIDPEAVRAFRPSYRLLSYYLASRGIPVQRSGVSYSFCPRGIRRQHVNVDKMATHIGQIL